MKKLSKFIVLVLIFFNLSCSSYAEPLELSEAQSCILIDSKTGQILYEKNSDQKGLFPASTTKIMTAILAIEMGNPEQLMTASLAAVNDIGKDGMNIGIMAGEEIKLENLLEALMIRSANETANIIAENLCAKRSDFVELMNKKAQELGALDTHFANPCGAHDDNHYTTASDLAKIARYGMSLPKFRELASRKNFQMLPTNKHSEWPVLATTNNLLLKGSGSDLYSINGIKSGYTVPAGHCLVSSAANDLGMELIAVVLGVKNDGAKNNVVKYSRALFEHGFKNYALQNIITEGEVIQHVAVANAKDSSGIDLITRSGLDGILPLEKSQWGIERKVDLKPYIQAPVSKGETLGQLEFTRNGVSMGAVDLIAAAPVDPVIDYEVKQATKEVMANSLFKKVLVIAASVLTFFILLRFALRKISRKLRLKRYSK
jgi:D-alanyl-D-alanine carboxypeptidase/D-alanyl-D-alanine carboxypeptidase (penicillin-binding protein 5/6)